MDDDIINVYVCPTEGCGNYYGAPSMGKLEGKANIAPGGTTNPGSITSFRSRCPNCGATRVLRYARLIPQDEVDQVRKTAKADSQTQI